MKLFAFFRGQGIHNARLVRVETINSLAELSPLARTEMRERLRDLVTKAEQKRRLRNLQPLSAALVSSITAGREQSDEGDSRCLAA